MAADRTPPPRSTRLLLILGSLAGLSVYLLTPLEQPDQLTLATDVYFHAVSSFFDGNDLYLNHPPDRSGYNYLYPPITVLLFLPHILTGSALGAYILQTILNIIAGIATTVVIVRALKRRSIAVTRIDAVLIALLLLVSSYGAIQLINGQVNLWIAFALALGFDAFDRDRERITGIAFAIAALLKVFPAILGLWLLRTRSWIGVGAALATGIGGLLLGAVVFGPELTITYFADVLLARFGDSTYDGRPAPTDNVDGIHRQLAALWPAGEAFYTGFSILIIGSLLTISYSSVTTRYERDIAALATICGILLFLPLQPLYFPLITFPLCMLLFRPHTGRIKWLFVSATLLTFVHIDLQAVELWLATIPTPELVADVLIQVSTALFTLILPPTIGLWMLLLICVWIQLPSLDDVRQSISRLR